MTPSGLIEKARRAAKSAELFLDAGDVDGATNRAYYAMFDAARAALAWTNDTTEPQTIKTHGGLISVFSRQLVKPGRLPSSLGRTMNWVAELRQMPDYTGDEVTIEKARWAVEQATLFLEAITKELAPGESRDRPSGQWKI